MEKLIQYFLLKVFGMAIAGQGISLPESIESLNVYAAFPFLIKISFGLKLAENHLELPSPASENRWFLSQWGKA